MFNKVHIRRHERGLLFRRGDFVRPLGPGTYRIPVWRLGKDRIEVFDTLKTRFEHPLLDVLVRDPAMLALIRVVELSDTQRALVWRDGRLFQIVGPGRHAYWTGPAELAGTSATFVLGQGDLVKQVASLTAAGPKG